MSAILDIAAPVFGLVLAGFLAGRAGILGPESSVALNRFVYYFALPPVMFLGTARAPLAALFNGPYIASILGGLAVALTLSLVVGRFVFGVRQPALAVQAVGGVFPNVGYMGIPLFLTAFGPDGALLAVIYVMVGSFVCMAGAIGAIELHRASTEGGQILAKVGGALVRNPLLGATVLGTVWSWAALPVPAPVGNFLGLLGAASGPAALFALGLSLVGQRLAGDRIEIAWMTFLKLIVQPAATGWLAFFVFDLPIFWAWSAVLLAALPTAALVYVVAQRYDVYLRRASTLIVVTTALSVISVSAILAAMGAAMEGG
ncbi:MAG: AEC family transporter [Rhodospirillaceae bacterium]|jgi:malonate transporter and related proteins|nr:AEC family transporter [Rhodospirillaceae bacterium]MBT6119097.1 AEC family transporter [Rhodospirillaceae bacterium]